MIPVRIACHALVLSMAGCLDGRALDAPLPATVAIERTDASQPILRVQGGALPSLTGRRVDLPIGDTTFLVHHDGGGSGGEEYDGDVPMTALWIRGRGPARHLLPSLGSPPLRIDTMEEWSVTLPAGVYDLSVTLGTDPPGTVSEPAVLVVR